MRHHRDARLGQLAPRVVEHRVVRVEAAHLQVALEHPGALAHRVPHIGGRARFREERRGVQAVRVPFREAGRPVVQRPGHAGLVRVQQRRERADAEPAQHLQPPQFFRAVADRPGPADQRTGRVEVRPHRGEQPVRHEVGVHVDQVGQAVAPPELRDPVLFRGGRVLEEDLRAQRARIRRLGEELRVVDEREVVVLRHRIVRLRHGRCPAGDDRLVVRQEEYIVAPVGGLLADLPPDRELDPELGPPCADGAGQLVLIVRQRDGGQPPQSGQRVFRVVGPPHGQERAVASAHDDRHGMFLRLHPIHHRTGPRIVGV